MNYAVTDTNMCPISFETYEDLKKNNSLVCTPCSHLFQDMALTQWLTVQPTCPLCRMVIHLGDVTYGELPKETLLKKIQDVFLCIIGGVKNLFEGIGKAIKNVFSNENSSFVHDSESEVEWPLVLDS